MASTLSLLRVRRPLMRWFQQYFCRRPSKQHLISMVLLAGFFAALLPIPFSLSLHGTVKDRSEPFPCQDRPCACRSAEQCRKTCCCFTPQQKMAWAKRRGLNSFDVPHAEPKPIALANSMKCCSQGKLSKDKKARVTTSNHCVRNDSDPSRPVSHMKIVIGVAAQKCQGVDQTLTGLPIFLIPPKAEVALSCDPKGERLISLAVQLESSAAEPPVPPPRLKAI